MMKRQYGKSSWIAALVSVAMVSGGSVLQAASGKKTLMLDFENVPAGSLPAGWQVAATHPNGRPNAWRVQEDSRAVSGKKVLALPETPRFYGGTFNLCWTDEVSFQDGVIQVKVHAGTGNEDQGGGPIWRVKDANNYYIVRWNPLEDNFRLYFVKDGHRKQIATANVKADPKQWHTIKVVQKGQDITCYLDGKKLLTATDQTFTEAGGVGLWTKADAASCFDDFMVQGK